ncbi:MAG: ABC transporter substrate-binding protein [Ignavibacteriales bacterium CG18_big_fil_WC_8_21_14_2_50_31_20]|nr:MAG: ABC transporter substrate-binding protein [Ignavibacteriales bacterium CG18_big_fil_WC_8_21_14_2_50_31_20]
MKNEKKAELKVGIIVIVAIIIFLWILGWAKNFSFNSNEKSLTISFQNVAGLVVGDFVSVQGIKEGYVKSLKNDNNLVLVDISLSDDVKLKEDAQFSIMMVDLMGGKKIEITPGLSKVDIDYSQIQNGSFVGDISTAMAALGEVQNDLVSIISEVKITLTSLNNVINNAEFTSGIQNSVTSLNKLIQKTDLIISNNSNSVSELLKNSNELVLNSNKFIVDNKDEIRTTFSNVSKLVKSTDTLMLKLSNFMVEVENKDNNLGKLLYNKDLVENLSLTLKKLKELTDTINKQINDEGLKVDANIF